MSRPSSAVQISGSRSSCSIRRSASNPQLNEERKPLKVLNLGIQFTPLLSNGIRPHGGHRGTKGSPPSRYSVNKDSDYHHRLKLMKEAQSCTSPSPPPSTPARPSTSPAWALRVVREQSKSAESPLFTKGLLSPKATDTKPVKFIKGSSPSTKRRYYRPNTAHEYLPATSNGEKENEHLGRPTRTTLLRAEQRCNSAPLNAYRYRREIMKKLQPDNKSSANRPMKGNYTPTFSTTDGESMHAFLIGARYNRAHFVDFKSFSHHGVYMPRDNPNSCFVHRPKSAVSLSYKAEKRSEAPPSTPCETHTPNPEPFVPPSPRQPSPVTVQREDGISPPPSTPRGEEELKSTMINHSVEKSVKAETTNATCSEPLDNLIIMNKGLNVIGRPFKGTTATNIFIPGSQTFLEESAVQDTTTYIRHNAFPVRQASKNDSPRIKNNVELDALQVVGVSKSSIVIPLTSECNEPDGTVNNTARTQNRTDINPSKSSKSENVLFFVTEKTEENPEMRKSSLAIEGVVVQSRPKKPVTAFAQTSVENGQLIIEDKEEVEEVDRQVELKEERVDIESVKADKKERKAGEYEIEMKIENEEIEDVHLNPLDENSTKVQPSMGEDIPSITKNNESVDGENETEREAEVISVRISHRDNLNST